MFHGGQTWRPGGSFPRALQACSAAAPCVPLQALNTADERQGLTWRPSALSAPAAIPPQGFGVPKERRRTPLSNQSSQLPGQGKQVILTGKLSFHACPRVRCRLGAPRGLGEAGVPRESRCVLQVTPGHWEEGRVPGSPRPLPLGAQPRS